MALLNRREETKVVKNALIAAGFTNVRVGHGRGAACTWLDIYCDDKHGQSPQDKRIEAKQVTEAVTGRSGEYAEIFVHLYAK